MRASLHISKFILQAYSLDELIALGTITPAAARFLEASVAAGLNVVVSGGTQAGKTTLLNCLCAAIPARERVISVEEVFELPLVAFLRKWWPAPTTSASRTCWEPQRPVSRPPAQLFPWAVYARGSTVAPHRRAFTALRNRRQS